MYSTTASQNLLYLLEQLIKRPNLCIEAAATPRSCIVQ
jgi:hypothetical protein